MQIDPINKLDTMYHLFLVAGSNEINNSRVYNALSLILQDQSVKSKSFNYYSANFFPHEYLKNPIRIPSVVKRMHSHRILFHDLWIFLNDC